MTDHRTDPERPPTPVYDDATRTTSPSPVSRGLPVEPTVGAGPLPGDGQTGDQGGSQTRETADRASQEGRELAGSAREHGAEVASTAREQGTVVAREAGSQAREVVDHTVQELRGQAQEQTTRVSGALSGAADQVRALAEGRPEDAGKAGDYARDLADRVGDVADRIDTLGFDGVVRELGDFARRRPGAFLAGAAVAGLLAGRLVRNAGGPDDGAGDASGGSLQPTTGTTPGGSA